MLAKGVRIITLLSCLGKLVEKVVGVLIAKEGERTGILHVGQFGCHAARSAADGAAVLFGAVEAAWAKTILATNV